tara:strand:+ start:59 stop:175 length:117 start_codon:yes stop_codon:yes gene_type:complete
MIQRIKEKFDDLSIGGKIFVIAAAVIIIVSVIQEVIGG